jgi:hypothetical protein
MTGVMPVARSCAKSAHYVGRAAQKSVRRGDHSRDPDRNEGGDPSDVGSLDQGDRIGPVVNGLPHTERAACDFLSQVATELEALDPRNRSGPDRPIRSLLVANVLP